MIQVKEVRETFAQTKPSKSSQKDNISCYFLKLGVPLIKASFYAYLIHHVSANFHFFLSSYLEAVL